MAIETKDGLPQGMVFDERLGWVPEGTAFSNPFSAITPFVSNAALMAEPVSELKEGFPTGMVFDERLGFIPQGSATNGAFFDSQIPSMPVQQPLQNFQPRYYNQQQSVSPSFVQNPFVAVPPANATIEQIIANIQGQYQPVMQAAPSLNDVISGIQGQQPLGQGAQRFISGVQNFGPIEQMTEYGRQPVAQSATPMTTFVPGAFDINQTSYLPIPSEAQIAARIGQGGSDYEAVPLSPQQEAFFNFLESPEGKSYKDARGAAMGNVIGSIAGFVTPVASISNLFTGQPNIGKSISNLFAADRAASEAAREALVNYGVTSTARGPTTAAQAQALIDKFVGPMPQEQQSSGGSSSYGTTGAGSASGIGVGSTEGINAMDAQSDAASASGGPASGKIVCTAMNNAYGFGSFRNAIWLKYAQNNLTKAHEAGYHAIFLPLVDFAYKRGDGFANKAVRSVLENIARHRSADLRAEMRGFKRDNLGRFYRAVLEPVCFVVGKIKGF